MICFQVLSTADGLHVDDDDDDAADDTVMVLNSVFSDKFRFLFFIFIFSFFRFVIGQ